MRSRGALRLGAGVFSHWALDLLVHRPDLPLLPHGPYVGLGLWNSIAGLWIEGALYVAGIAVYLRATRARDAIGRWGLWVLLVLLAAIWLSGPFSPAPTDVRTIAG